MHIKLISVLFTGTEIDGQLMGEFEADAKEFEADSWSFSADKKYLKQLKKDVVKRQDVIYGKVTDVHTETCNQQSSSDLFDFWTLYFQLSAVERMSDCDV